MSIHIRVRHFTSKSRMTSANFFLINIVYNKLDNRLPLPLLIHKLHHINRQVYNLSIHVMVALASVIIL